MTKKLINFVGWREGGGEVGGKYIKKERTVITKFGRKRRNV